MPNTNGLTSLAPVFYTGDPTSNLWMPEGGSGPSPLDLISPVTIESEDGTKSASITVGNAPGDMNINVPDGDLFLNPAGELNLIAGYNVSLIPQNGGKVLVTSNNLLKSATMSVDNTSGALTVEAIDNITISPGSGGELKLGNGSIWVMEPGVVGGQYTEIATSSAGATTIGSQGDITFITYGTNNIQVQKSGGAIGIVYDTVYNPLPSFPVITALGSSDGGIGNLAFGQAVTVVAGAMYQLQLSFEDLTSVADSYLSLAASDTGVGVIDYSGATLSAAAAVDGAGGQLMSNYFIAPDTSFTVTVNGFKPNPPPGTAVNWTANWKLQLVRIK